MGRVLCVMKVFPEEQDGIDAVLERVKKVDGCNTAKIIDYVFGSKVIQATFITEDGSGRDFEAEVAAVEGVSNVNVDEVGLI